MNTCLKCGLTYILTLLDKPFHGVAKFGKKIVRALYLVVYVNELGVIRVLRTLSSKFAEKDFEENITFRAVVKSEYNGVLTARGNIDIKYSRVDDKLSGIINFARYGPLIRPLASCNGLGLSPLSYFSIDEYDLGFYYMLLIVKRPSWYEKSYFTFLNMQVKMQVLEFEEAYILSVRYCGELTLSPLKLKGFRIIVPIDMWREWALRLNKIVPIRKLDYVPMPSKVIVSLSEGTIIVRDIGTLPPILPLLVVLLGKVQHGEISVKVFNVNKSFEFKYIVAEESVVNNYMYKIVNNLHNILQNYFNIKPEILDILYDQARTVESLISEHCITEDDNIIIYPPYIIMLLEKINTTADKVIKLEHADSKFVLESKSTEGLKILNDPDLKISHSEELVNCWSRIIGEFRELVRAQGVAI